MSIFAAGGSSRWSSMEADAAAFMAAGVGGVEQQPEDCAGMADVDAEGAEVTDSVLQQRVVGVGDEPLVDAGRQGRGRGEG